jgi:hypothetical protein
MKRLFVLIIAMVIVVISVPVFAQSAKDAILALKKLEARIEAGVNYRDYAQALGEAKFPIKLFQESAEAKENQEVNSHITASIGYFEIAKLVWDYKFGLGGARDFIPADNSLGKSILERFSGITVDRFGIFVDEAVGKYWAEASKEIKLASSTLATEETKQSTQKKELEKLKQENDALKAENERLKNELSNYKKSKPSKSR